MNTELTNEDQAIFLRFFNGRWSGGKAGYREADRKDAALMRSAQRYDYARAIATIGKPEDEAIQVR